MNAQINWFGAFTSVIPSFKCAPATVPAPTTYTVNPVGVVSCLPQTSGSLYYNTISSAVAAAPAGATIKVCPGVYPEQVLVTKPLTIIGVPNTTTTPYSYPEVVPPGGALAPISYNGSPLLPLGQLQQKDGSVPVAAQIAVVGANGVNLSNLLLDGYGATNAVPLSNTGSTHVFGIYYQNASGSISNNIVANYLVPNYSGDTGYGIYVEAGLGTTGSSTVTISTNGVLNYQASGILATGSVTATVNANSVALQQPSSFESPNAVEFATGATGSITNNTIANASWTGNPAASVGIAVLIVASQNNTISGNTITGSDFGVITFSDPAASFNGSPFVADGNTISLNQIVGNFGSSAYNYPGNDGIDACSNNNLITLNAISSFQNSDVHSDSGCASGSYSSGISNYISTNNVANSCAGLAEGGTNDVGVFNTINNTTFTVFGGDVCAVGATSTISSTDFNYDNTSNVPGSSALQVAMLHYLHKIRW